MDYQPRPADTSKLTLGSLQSLTEHLAEQTHEVWARQRMDEGWTFGPARDDQKKETPNLVPYSALPESEKDYDRKVSEHAVKLILQRGYTIEPPPMRVPTPALENGPNPADRDDMVDDQEIEWLNQSIASGQTELTPFAAALEFFRKEFQTAYRAADKAAMRFQWWYLRASFWCTFFAGLSVLLAIYQLTGFPQFGLPHGVLPLIELGLVTLAVGGVLLSYQFKWQDGWLIHRLKAERLRELKFRTIIDPSFWDPATRLQKESECRKSVREIERLETGELYSQLFVAAPPPEEWKSFTGNDKLDAAVTSYYLRRRLSEQARYLQRKSHKFHHQDSRTRTAGIVLFFAVLLFVFSHAALDVVMNTDHIQNALATEEGQAFIARIKTVGQVFIALAAGIPALGAALRVYRSGREAGRNHLRSEAVYRELSRLQQELEGSDTAPAQIALMSKAEFTLANEHREWLRLMKECEWFG